MQDFWNSCFEPVMGMNPEQFTATFCNRCTNPDCSRSTAGKLRWTQRMSTQEDRLLINPNFADPRDPKYTPIVNLDFKNLLRQALTIEIASRKGDWSVPSEMEVAAEAAKITAAAAGIPMPPVADPIVEAAVRSMKDVSAAADTAHPDYVIQTKVKGANGNLYDVTLNRDGEWSCSCPAFKFSPPPQSCKHIELMEGQADQGAPPEPPPALRLPVSYVPPARVHEPLMRNTPMPSGGIMVDGSAPPPRASPPSPTNPWALPAGAQPSLKGTVVPVGAKVVMGRKS